MTSCVVDASIFGPLFFEDETDGIFGGLAGMLSNRECVAPVHWRLELTNQVLVGTRRNRMAPEEASLAIDQLANLDVEIDLETWQKHVEIFQLAVKHRLTAYDAAYLELAIRRKFSLASYDVALRTAASSEGLQVFPHE